MPISYFIFPSSSGFNFQLLLLLHDLGTLLDISQPRFSHQDSGSSYCTHLIGLPTGSKTIMFVQIKRNFFDCKQMKNKKTGRKEKIQRKYGGRKQINVKEQGMGFHEIGSWRHPKNVHGTMQSCSSSTELLPWGVNSSQIFWLLCSIFKIPKSKSLINHIWSM